MEDLSFIKNKIIAHRGYHDEKVPENSMKAFKKAIENEMPIELDVHILKDNNIVVFHDDNLKRMTNVDKKIKNTTYDEIKNLKLSNTNECIPLFKEVLKLIDGNVPIVIELKYDVRGKKLVLELMKLLKDYNGKYVIKSFNPILVYYLKKYYPNVPRGLLVSDFKNTRMPILRKILLRNMLLNFIIKPDFISYDIRNLPNKRIEKIRKSKLVLGWTFKNIEDYEMKRQYCDSFICEGNFVENIVNTCKIQNL